MTRQHHRLIGVARLTHRVVTDRTYFNVQQKMVTRPLPFDHIGNGEEYVILFGSIPAVIDIGNV